MNVCATFLVFVYHACGLKHNSDAPDIAIRPRSVLLIGESVTIECSSSYTRSFQYQLFKDNKLLDTGYATNGTSVEFLMQGIQKDYNGIYRCGYTVEMTNLTSKLSSPAHIIVLASLPKPLITIPDEILEGQTVTLNCTCSYPYWELVFILYQGQTKKRHQSVPSGNCTATFLLRNISQQDEGSYICQYKTVNPVVFSDGSAIKQVTISGHYTAPRINMTTGSLLLSGETIRISCFCDSCHMENMRFELNKNEKPILYLDTKSVSKAEFTISNISKEDGGNYCCSVINLENNYRSANSRPIQVTVADASSTHNANDNSSSSVKHMKDSNFIVINEIRFGICAVVIVLMAYFILEAWCNRNTSQHYFA